MSNNTANPAAADVDGPVETVAYWRDLAGAERRRADELQWQLDIITTVVDVNRRLRG